MAPISDKALLSHADELLEAMGPRGASTETLKSKFAGRISAVYVLAEHLVETGRASRDTSGTRVRYRSLEHEGAGLPAGPTPVFPAPAAPSPAAPVAPPAPAEPPPPSEPTPDRAPAELPAPAEPVEASAVPEPPAAEAPPTPQPPPSRRPRVGRGGEPAWKGELLVHLAMRRNRAQLGSWARSHALPWPKVQAVLDELDRAGRLERSGNKHQPWFQIVEPAVPPPAPSPAEPATEPPPPAPDTMPPEAPPTDPPPPPEEGPLCPVCQRAFRPRTDEQRYCGPVCTAQAWQADGRAPGPRPTRPEGRAPAQPRARRVGGVS